jgi:hypothetical protein
VILLADAARSSIKDLTLIDEAFVQDDLSLAVSHHPSLELALEQVAVLGPKRSLAVIGPIHAAATGVSIHSTRLKRRWG